jgi:hypothetical protein
MPNAYQNFFWKSFKLFSLQVMQQSGGTRVSC